MQRAGLLAALALAGCGGDEGEGKVRVTAYGEAFIEQGIPADEMADGWAVQFDRFEVHIQDVSVAGGQLKTPPKVDLTPASSEAGQLLGAVSAPAGTHTGAGFTIARVEVAGSASKGAARKRFQWVFDQPTRYAGCHNQTVVPDGGEAVFQITVHADHLFYDSAVAEAPKIRFDALAAADKDGDGVITQAELAATDIGAYDPGSSSGVDDLWSYLKLMVGTLGHVDGEGHCQAAPGA